MALCSVAMKWEEKKYSFIQALFGSNKIREKLKEVQGCGHGLVDFVSFVEVKWSECF